MPRSICSVKESLNEAPTTLAMLTSARPIISAVRSRRRAAAARCPGPSPPRPRRADGTASRDPGRRDGPRAVESGHAEEDQDGPEHEQREPGRGVGRAEQPAGERHGPRWPRPRRRARCASGSCRATSSSPRAARRSAARASPPGGTIDAQRQPDADHQRHQPGAGGHDEAAGRQATAAGGQQRIDGDATPSPAMTPTIEPMRPISSASAITERMSWLQRAPTACSSASSRTRWPRVIEDVADEHARYEQRDQREGQQGVAEDVDDLPEAVGELLADLLAGDDVVVGQGVGHVSRSSCWLTPSSAWALTCWSWPGMPNSSWAVGRSNRM